MRSKLIYSLFATACLGAALLAPVAPSYAFNSGDVPAPVDGVDQDGPGRSHLSASGTTGFDGNQGNDKAVGNAQGGPAIPPPDDGAGVLPQ